MGASGIDGVIWLLGFLTELCLIIVLLRRREFEQFPVFLISIIFFLVEDPFLLWVTHHATSILYYRAETIGLAIDSILQLSVLVEIAYKVLRPSRRCIPRKYLLLLVIALIVVLSCTLVWAFIAPAQSDALRTTFLHLQAVSFNVAWLRIGLFVCIAGFSQMLGITWKNHVLRLAAGLAFYSAIALVVQLTISHLPQGNPDLYTTNYYLLQRTQVIAYLCALAFWVWSFLQKDAPRREFTPQMQRVLVTISQATRRSRVSMTRNLGHK